MAFNIEEQVNLILKQKEDRKLAEHIWLDGFHRIVKDVYLDIYKVIEYLNEISLKFPPFAKLQSGSLILYNKYLVENGKLSSVHLPINNDYHLLFYLVAENDCMQKFFYDSCPDCRLLESNGFPHFELRRSVDIKFGKGPILYDNQESVSHAIMTGQKKIITKGYKSIINFVENSKLN